MFSISEHQANATGNESKKDKQMIEELETKIDDLAETLCTSKLIIYIMQYFLSHSLQTSHAAVSCFDWV